MTSGGQDKKRVFISYVRENSDKIDQICEVFRRNNIEYWLDRDQIEPGKIWKKAIRDAINQGVYFLACFSKEYEARNETYMNEELLVAVDIMRTKHYDSGWFIPIKLSDCEIPPIDIGYGKTLQDLHYLNLYEDWDTEMKRLIDVIKREEAPTQSEMPNDYFEKEYIYQGLKSLIESGNGAGFHNADLGHPVYHIGASDAPMEILREWEYADSPQKNMLFKMLSKLSKELKSLNPDINIFIWWYDFSEWKDFCKFGVDVYDKRRGFT